MKIWNVKMFLFHPLFPAFLFIATDLNSMQKICKFVIYVC